MVEQENPPPPVTSQAAGTAGGGSKARAVGFWWKEVIQESLLFGAILLIVGFVLVIPCNSFIRGVAGNIVAAGIVFILFAGVKPLADWMRKSPDPIIDRLARCLRLKGGG
jgi:hypothetical protein